MSRVLGFTGTEHGMTAAQAATLRRVIRQARRDGADRLVHGCCVGADEQAAEIAKGERLKVVGFPGRPKGAPGRTEFRSDVEFAVPKGRRPELNRNRTIASTCDRLLATPRETREVLRSGTWATVRYARAQAKQVTIIWPDGTTSDGRSS